MKRMIKPGLLLAVLVLVVAVCAGALAAPVTINVSTNEEWAAAGTTIRNGGAGEYIISLRADIDNAGGLNFNTPDTTTTILGNGHTITLTGSNNSITVSAGVVNLGSENVNDKLIITRNDANDCPGAIYVNRTVDGTCTCNMYSGTTIKDVKGSNYVGGGVTIHNGIFNMHGGVIRNCGISGGSVCYGGGVSVEGYGVFNMYDGTITENYVSTTHNYNEILNPSFRPSGGGGIAALRGGIINISGGTITGNRATDGVGGGIAVYGGGALNFTGGVVSNNTAANYGGGIYATSYQADRSVISFDATVGGGSPTPDKNSNSNSNDPPSKSSINIGAVTIKNNSVTGKTNVPYAADVSSASGGGIMLMAVKGIPVSFNGTTITDNRAQDGYGGGVCVAYDWTTTSLTDTAINSNSAAKGAGLAIVHNQGAPVTTVNSSAINNNTASTIYGGGVYYDNSPDQAHLLLKGSVEISGNKSTSGLTQNTSKANDLYCWGERAPVYVGTLDSAVIGVTDDYLIRNTENATRASHALTKNYSQFNTAIPKEYFISNHDTWYPDYGEAGTIYEPEVRLVKPPVTYPKLVYHLGVIIKDHDFTFQTDYNPDSPVALAASPYDVQWDDYYNRGSKYYPKLIEDNGYSFTGWLDKDGQPITMTPNEDLGEVHVYGNWVKYPSYTMYDNHDGDCDSKTGGDKQYKSDKYDPENPLALDTGITWNGHTFTGWYMKANPGTLVDGATYYIPEYVTDVKYYKLGEATEMSTTNPDFNSGIEYYTKSEVYVPVVNANGAYISYKYTAGTDVPNGYYVFNPSTPPNQIQKKDLKSGVLYCISAPALLGYVQAGQLNSLSSLLPRILSTDDNGHAYIPFTSNDSIINELRQCDNIPLMYLEDDMSKAMSATFPAYRRLVVYEKKNIQCSCNILFLF